MKVEQINRPMMEKTPWELAECSPRAQKAYNYILNSIAEIRDERLRTATEEMLFSQLSLAAQREPLVSRPGTGVEKMRAILQYDPLKVAPGADLNSHHSYPGGWAIHTMINLQTMLSLIERAEEQGAFIQKDQCLVAMLLHDWAKLKLMVWDSEHNLDSGQGIGHHLLAIAETMARGFSPLVVQLLAGIHGGWWFNREWIESSIAKAGGWISLDPYAADYLPVGWVVNSLEAWILHQAETSWKALSFLLVQLDPQLKRWHLKQDNQYSFCQVRNCIYAANSELELFKVYQKEGFEGLTRFLDNWFGKLEVK